MRYKILLAGRNQSVIDDFFNQADDEFEAVTTSVRYTDIIRHLPCTLYMQCCFILDFPMAFC